MLWGLAILFLALWGLGLVTSYPLGGLVHILLVLAVVVVGPPGSVTLTRGLKEVAAVVRAFDALEADCD
jgi:hypothetical protein